jgi:large subunit ribosomal protein L24|tara:strand:+ start:78 stop:395 length:318 start_codon:yes stop_codon:yes gene_type:complete
MGSRIKKGDRVVVLSGRNKGQSGEVIRILNKQDRVIVQGVNMVKRHTRATQTNAGGIVTKEASIHLSNVIHVDPKTDKPTRIGYKFLEDGRKVRFAKASGEVIDK